MRAETIIVACKLCGKEYQSPKSIFRRKVYCSNKCRMENLKYNESNHKFVNSKYQKKRVF